MKFPIRPFLLGMLFALVAGCGGGGGGDGGTTSTTNGSPPSSPVGITVSANNAANSLQWNSVMGATGYNVYWSTTSGAGTSGTKIASAASPYSHGPLENGTTYYYVITAVNSFGESAPSAQASGTPAVPPPGAPSLGSVTPGDRKVLLSWNPVQGGTTYNLYWSNSSGTAASGTKISNVTSPYQHAPLTNGTTYYYALTAVTAAGESSPSTVVGATPFAAPYATQQYPFDLGTMPFENGHDEVMQDSSTSFHYTLSVKPGSVYKASLNNVLDGASLEVFTQNGWDIFDRVCSDYSYEYTKPRNRCVFTAPESGIIYIRIGSTTEYPENVNLKIDEVINQGSREAPIDLGVAPSTPAFGTVREAGESVYQVAVTAGRSYRVQLTDWTDNGASRSQLYLEVYDGSNTVSPLCIDFGGNSETDHEHRLPIIHCLAKPASDVLTIVTRETQYGEGAAYNVAVEEALTEGAPGAPVDIVGDALVYHGEVTATQQNYDDGYSYYQFSVTPNTNYLVDLRGMHQELDLVIYPDSSFATLSECNSRNGPLIDDYCIVPSDAAGKIYARVETWQDVTDRFILSAMPVPAGAVAPARYPDEGSAAAPIQMGPGLPVPNRLSTVGIGNSYYSIAVASGSTMRVSATQMNVDVDIHVYADATYANRLCASRNGDVADDTCIFTVPNGVSAIYIRVDGQFTTNNGSWSSGTEQDVGAMFRLSVE
jgi:hypothetical protein